MSESVFEGSARKKSSAESREVPPEKEKQEATAVVDDKDTREKSEKKYEKEKPNYTDKDVVEDEGLYKSLQSMPYYHGFLPREDLQAVLVNEGDYLIRVSEVTTKKKEGTAIKRDIVLSLCSADQAAPAEEKDPKSDANVAERKMRNLVIRRYEGKFALKNGCQFPTIDALLENYNVSNTSETKSNRMLKNAVYLQNWEIRHSAVKLGDKLGEGAYGEVRKGVLQRKGRNFDVAVKLMKGSGDMNKVKIREMMKEARLMRNFKHKNVVRFFGVAVVEQPLYIILELVNGGALNTYLQKNKNVSTLELLTMCLGAAQGLQYLHANQCIHRDIAARNCLYSVDKIVKLSDFGLSLLGTAYKLCTSQKLPIKWLAPETITTLFFTPKTDVYSYGVMCYEIYAEGEEPWDGTSNTEAKKNVVLGKHLQMPEACPEKFRSFIHEKIFVVDPKRRVVMDDVVRFIEPIINDMHNATATFVVEKTEPVAPRPSSFDLGGYSPRNTLPSTMSNNTNSSKKLRSRVLRKKAEKTKKDKKKKAAHPGNHNMVEK